MRPITILGVSFHPVLFTLLMPVCVFVLFFVAIFRVVEAIVWVVARIDDHRHRVQT